MLLLARTRSDNYPRGFAEIETPVSEPNTTTGCLPDTQSLICGEPDPPSKRDVTPVPGFQYHYNMENQTPAVKAGCDSSTGFQYHYNRPGQKEVQGTGADGAEEGCGVVQLRGQG
jgi:hypothetical protein